MSEEMPTAAPAEEISAEEQARLKEQERFKVALIDQSKDALDEARDRADARLDRELGEGGRFKRFVNGLWKGNFAKEIYRQKYIHQELDTISQADDVLVNEDAEKRTSALRSTIDRFTDDYHEELVHTKAGERREELSEDNALSVGVKDIIRKFAEGTLNPATLREERTRLLNDYRKENGEEAVGKGIASVDNLLEIAQAVAGAVEHGESLDHVMSKVDVITGEARNGARTETRQSNVDKIVDKLSSSKVGTLVRPSTLAVVAAGVGSIARVGGQGVIGNISRALVPGAVAGVWAGLRENKRVKDERTQHSREMAVGGTFNEDDKRRVEMDKTRYDSIEATKLISLLNWAGNAETFEQQGDEALQAALDALARVQARVDLSDNKKLDLISYSSKTDVGEERMMLDLARRETRMALDERLTPEARQRLGLGQNAELGGLISQRSLLIQRAMTEGEGGINERDELFAKLKRKRVANAAVTGTVVGIAGGLLVQEVVASMDTTRFGLIDAIRGDEPVPLESDGLVHQTTLESIFRGDETTVHTDASDTYESYSTGENGVIEVSDDHELISNEDGTYDLHAGNGDVTVEGLVVDENGTLDQASLDKLDDAGMVVEDHSYTEEIVHEEIKTVSTHEYLQNHADESTKVTRDFWYGNDTPGVYDENELRVYRGGSADAPGLVDGGYQYTVAGMTAEGSWQGGEQVNWNEAATNGNLFVAVSGTYDSQGNPFMIPIGPNGEVNIPADSPAGQFFANENNSVAFNGAYMEIVQTAGVEADGTVHIRPLATLVGDTSVGEIQDTITTTETVQHAEYTITTEGYDTTESNFTEMAPITPITSRRSMEAIRQPEALAEVIARKPYDYYGGEISTEERERIAREISPRLRDNPERTLNPKEELDWFKEDLTSRQGAEYVASLTAFVENDPALSKIDSNTESIVIIPVRGSSESENIYGTLSLYAQQSREPGKNTAVLLNVNWLDTTVEDVDKFAEVQKTIAEIERARQDFPDLRISVIQKEYVESEVTKTGGAIGYVTNDLINTALLAVQNKMADGSLPSDHEMLIVRSDADMHGIARSQLSNYEKAAKENGTVDVFKGVLRFGVEEQRRFPGFGIVTNFSQALAASKTQENKIHTGGPNFAVRASTLAAVGGFGDLDYTGVASDDVGIGNRISVGRNIGWPKYGYESVSESNGSDVKRVKLVSGAAVDTNADRMLPFYAKGLSFQAAWDGTAGGFDSGQGGYAERTVNNGNAELNNKERYDTSFPYDAIETNISRELNYASPVGAKKALALFFGSVAGAYTLEGTIGTDTVRFKLTDKGREFVKNRVERETNGKFGPYGMRKLRQLYGIVGPKAKRQPVATQAPLVSPLT